MAQHLPNDRILEKIDETQDGQLCALTIQLSNTFNCSNVISGNRCKPRSKYDNNVYELKFILEKAPKVADGIDTWGSRYSLAACDIGFFKNGKMINSHHMNSVHGGLGVSLLFNLDKFNPRLNYRGEDVICELIASINLYNETGDHTVIQNSFICNRKYYSGYVRGMDSLMTILNIYAPNLHADISVIRNKTNRKFLCAYMTDVATIDKNCEDAMYTEIYLAKVMSEF